MSPKQGCRAGDPSLDAEAVDATPAIVALSPLIKFRRVAFTFGIEPDRAGEVVSMLQATSSRIRQNGNCSGQPRIDANAREFNGSDS